MIPVNPRNEKGFTLVEVLIVVGLIGLLVTMGTASFSGWLKRSSFKDQKNQIYDTLTRARNMANSRNECVVVTVAGQTLSVVGHLRGTNGNCAPVGAQTISLADVTLKTGFTPERFNGTDNSITFNPYGGLEPSSVATIYLTEASGQRGGYRIYPALGQIRNIE